MTKEVHLNNQESYHAFQGNQILEMKYKKYLNKYKIIEFLLYPLEAYKENPILSSI